MKKVDIGLIDTLILCGGKGTRLQTVVPDKPKILADIGGSPFIEYLLNYLEKEGIKRIILCSGYKHNQIKEWEIDRNFLKFSQMWQEFPLFLE